MNNPISDCFDTRDLIEYIEFIGNDFVETWNTTYKRNYKIGVIINEDIEDPEEFEEALDVVDIDFENEDFTSLLYQSDIDEYNSLIKFQDELEQADDYQYGVTVIREDYFVDYCKNFLEDCGYIKSDMPHWIEIDYDATADNMKADYIEVEYEGDTYYAR